MFLDRSRRAQIRWALESGLVLQQMKTHDFPTNAPTDDGKRCKWQPMTRRPGRFVGALKD